MDVRCEKCSTEYVLDDKSVSAGGMAVRCTECGHVFRVRVSDRGGGVTSEPHGRKWLLRKDSGKVFAFDSLATLQRWIVEKRATADDEISDSGMDWKKLTEIQELSAFFRLLEQLDEAKRAGEAGKPPARKAVAVELSEPDASGEAGQEDEEDVDDLSDMEIAVPRRRGKWIAVGVLPLLVIGAAAAFYFVDPDRALELVGLHDTVSEEAPEAASAEEPAESEATEEEAEVVQAGEEPSEADEEESDSEEPTVADAEKPEEPEQIKAEVTPAVAKAEAAPEPEAPRRPTYSGLLQQARRERNRGNIDRALDLYTQAGQMRPNSADAYAGQGYCYVEMRAWHAAIASFEQALKRDSRHGDSLIGMADAQRLDGNAGEAKKYYERYLELYPEGSNAAVARTNLERL